MTLLDAWHNFVALELPVAATDVETEQQRQAFYGGAIAAWGVLMTADTDPGGEMAVMGRIHQELTQYSQGIAASKKKRRPRKRR